MVRTARNEYVPDQVSPPGATLQELLEDRGISQAEFAVRTGRPKKTINEIIQGKAAITPETALQFEMVLGTPAHFWNNREAHYRDYLARREEEQRMQEAVDWLKRIPLNAMIKLGWVRKFGDKALQVREALAYFGVATPTQWDEVYSAPQAAFRRSTAFEVNEGAVAAWLRKGEIEAEKIDTKPYKQKRFREALAEARSLTVRTPEEFAPDLVYECADAGVAVVFVKSMPKSRVSGASRWLTSEKALIQLSLRGKTTDRLWFTFFHEAAHVLQQVKKAVFLDDDNVEGEEERQADAFAARTLIPPDDFERLCSMPRFTKDRLRRFADEIGIAPGIVVGRLQHEGLLPYSRLNDLKEKVQWADEA